MQHWFTYPNINPIAIQIGPVGIHWYGLSYLAGFILVFLWLNRPAGRRRLGLSTEEIQDFLVYALIGVLVGGRIFFVLADIVTRHTLADYISQSAQHHRSLERRDGILRRLDGRDARNLAFPAQTHRI